MPYFKREELGKIVDSKGTPIQINDVLESTDPNPNNPWRYFAVIDENTNIYVRDFNAHNVCMCNLGLKGDVVTLGNYLNNLHIKDVEKNQDWFTEYHPSQEEMDEALKELPRRLKEAFKNLDPTTLLKKNVILDKLKEKGRVKPIGGGSTISTKIKFS